MNIDERLEKLAERHEALAQSVELLSLEGRATDVRLQKLELIVREVTGGIRDLVSVVRSHEQRLSKIEGST